MHCEEVQKELLVQADLTTAARDHLADCPACQAFAADQLVLTQQLQTWRDLSAPPALGRSIATRLNAPTPFRYRKLLWGSLWGSLAGACVLAGFVYVGSSGGKAQASAYVRMQRATALVNTAHLKIIYNVRPSGPPVLKPVVEAWYRAGARRQGTPGENDDSILLKQPDGWKYYRWDPKLVRVQEFPQSAPKEDSFSIEQYAGSWMDEGLKTYQATGQELLGGVLTQKIEAKDASGLERMVFWVDPATMLPLRAEKLDLEHGRWVTYGRFEFELNQPIPPEVFDPATLGPKKPSRP